VFKNVEEAQGAICPSHKVFEPADSEAEVYDEMYGCGGSCILGLEPWVGVRLGMCCRS